MKTAILLGLSAICIEAALLQAHRPLKGWEVIGRAPPSRQVNVIFGLKLADKTGERLAQTGEPSSPEFRNWATREEAIALRGAASPEPLVRYLKAHGVSPNVVVDAVQATMSVAQIEEAFATTVRMVRSTATGTIWHHALDLHVPLPVASTVDAVFGVHGLPLPPRKTSIRQNRTRTGDPPNIGPGDLRTLYQVTGRGSGSTKVRQAVAEFQGQFSNQADLTAFFNNLVPYRQKGDDQVYAQKGNVASGDGVEALLDIQYIMGVAPGVKTEFWGWRNFDFCTDLKNWTTTILGDANPPLVFSVSYGWQGDLSQIGCTSDEVNSIDADMQSIANRGISIIFASGDSGSAYDGTTLWPSWPASSPFVTAVGSTTFSNGNPSPPSATTQFGSGSGFSSQFPVAAWQRSVVAAYKNSQSSSLPPSGTWSPNGRATADVSALGEGFQVYVDGSVEIVGGTSASAPTFAAIIALVNDRIVAAGGKPLGYLNPWIYANPSFWTDVTIGSDMIGRDGSPLQYGFACTPGWDPPTGFGTPVYPRIHAAELARLRQ